MRSNQHQLQQPALQGASFHPVIRTAAKIISILFHPLFIPVYISWFLIYNTPVFPGFSSSDKFTLLLRFFVMYTVFPLTTVLLAKGLGFIQSIYLKTQKDRIIPYIACGLYYFWMWYVLKNQKEFPQELILLSLAIFLASSCGLIVNNYIKVSMHAISVGVLAAFILSVSFLSDANYGIYISLAVLLAGLVCTARLVNTDHHPVEVYAGLFIGIIAQTVAYWFVN
ncbi:MAG: phosphatase PAP2 family protein [Chitinophagaceae bacterium]